MARKNNNIYINTQIRADETGDAEMEVLLIALVHENRNASQKNDQSTLRAQESSASAQMLQLTSKMYFMAIFCR